MAVLSEGILLFDTVPREVGYSREYISSLPDFRNWIAIHNGVSDCWVSYFSFPVRFSKSDYGDAVHRFARFDKIPLDTDIDEGYECTMLLHEKLKKQGIIHQIHFSGRLKEVDGRPKGIGYHIFIPIVESVKYKVPAFKNTTSYFNELIKRAFLKEYGLNLDCLCDKCPVIWNQNRKANQQLDGRSGKSGIGKERDCLTLCPFHHEPFDQIVNKVGLGGMTRYPNTLNIKRNRFCIPLTEIQLATLDAFEIAELAHKQNFADNFWIGDHIYTVPSRFDVKPPPENNILLPVANIASQSDILKRKENRMAHCVKYLLTLPKPDFEQRFFIILCLRDLGLTQQETENVLREAFDPVYYKHCTEPSPGEDMINRCYTGNQAGEWLKGGCKAMRRASQCDPACKRSHPYCV